MQLCKFLIVLTCAYILVTTYLLNYMQIISKPYLKCHKLSPSQMCVSWVRSSCIQHEVLCVPLHSALLDSCVGAPQNTPLLET